MTLTGVDTARVRGLYPTLPGGAAHLDGAFAALQPESVIRAIIATLRSAPAQPGSTSARSRASATRLLRTRHAVADLVAAAPEDVVLGDSITSLLQRFTIRLASDWQLGDEIVLSRVDSDAVMRPWLRAARGPGVGVRWAEIDVETGELPTWQYESLIGRRTRIVTLSLANPATGMAPDVRAVADLAHGVGALVVVDAGTAPSYLPLDLDELGADLLAVAAPSFGGPTIASLVARPGLLGELGEAAPLPQQFELAPLPIELLDGYVAAIDHLADLDENAQGTRRERLVASISAVGEYTLRLYARLDEGLRGLPGVTVLGAPDRTVPVAAFSVNGRTPDEVGNFLARRGISVWTGASGHSELLRTFGADEYGGAAFVGVMAHTSPAEIEIFLDGMRALTSAQA